MAGSYEKISVVVPFYNEGANVDAVLAEIQDALPGAEIVAVDDGSSDDTWDRIRRFPAVNPVRHPRNLGQSAAFCSGLRQAGRELCVLMDGDGQNDPRDVPRLLEALPGADLVCGVRVSRRDPWNRRAASRFANAVRRMVLHDGATDTGCSLKAFRREHAEILVPFNGLHRYIPAFFASAGLRIVEVPVSHRPRREGTSKYTNLGRGVRGLHDLIGVRWLLKRRIRSAAERARD